MYVVQYRTRKTHMTAMLWMLWTHRLYTESTAKWIAEQAAQRYPELIFEAVKMTVCTLTPPEANPKPLQIKE